MRRAGEDGAVVDAEPAAVVTEVDAPTGTWAGTVAGTDAFVAVVASPEQRHRLQRLHPRST
jgi:hypothetical protein